MVEEEVHVVVDVFGSRLVVCFFGFLILSFLGRESGFVEIFFYFVFFLCFSFLLMKW